jgi:mono/diheme cytochrome c family protein
MSDTNPIMKYFSYTHLPPKLQEISKPIGDLAEFMDNNLPNGPEKSAGLRKLLEAKDCLVRAALPILVVGLLLFASSADACERCGLFGNRCALRKAVVVQQVVAAPVVYPQVYYGAPQISYFVGQNVRVEALIQKALQDDPTYAEFQRFRAWKQQLEATPAAPVFAAESPPAPVPSILTQKCGACHSGDAPKKGLLLDGSAKLTCEQMARAMKRVQDGSMPPKGTLTGEERGDVFQSLLDLVETK